MSEKKLGETAGAQAKPSTCDLVKSRTIRSLAVPALGPGLGGLAWTDVRPLVERAFAPLEEVDVRVFEPQW